MNKKINENTSELEIIVSLPQELWIKAQKKASKELASKLKVDGFRDGKIPEEMVKQKISDEKIKDLALSDSLQFLSTEAQKLIDKEFVIHNPVYDIVEKNNDKLTVKFIYPIFPKFEMPKYDNLKVKHNVEVINEAKIQLEIDSLLDKKTMLEDKNGNVANGDIAIIDFEGKINGEGFEGNKANDFQLKIGSKTFIDNFEEKLIGLSKGDKKSISLKFPVDYHQESLKGQDVVFDVSVKNVKNVIMPELNDEFVKTLGVEKLKSVVDLKSLIERNLKNDAAIKAREEFELLAFKEIREKAKIKISRILLIEEEQNMRKNFLDQLSKQKLSLENWLEKSKKTIEEFQAEIAEIANNKILNSILFAKIAELEKITANENDYEEKYNRLAEVYKKSLEEVKKTFSKEQIQILIINNKVLDKLIELNDHQKENVTDAEKTSDVKKEMETVKSTS